MKDEQRAILAYVLYSLEYTLGEGIDEMNPDESERLLRNSMKYMRILLANTNN